MRRSSLIFLIIIFVVPVTLFSSAILKVRDAAARTQCANNLKQMAVSIHNFHGCNNKLPLAIVTPTVELPPDRCISWWAGLHPFIESAPELRIDLSKPWDAHEQKSEVERAYPIALCPANDSMQADGRWLTHYIAILGVGKHSGLQPIGNPTRGVFSYRHHATFDDVKDGLANTMIFAETNDKNGCWLAGGYPTARGLDPDGPAYLGTGGQFGSGHRSSTIVAMMDGSVRMFSNTTSPRVFEALATIAGGEEVNLDD